MNSIARICVYCGASDGVNGEYLASVLAGCIDGPGGAMDWLLWRGRRGADGRSGPQCGPSRRRCTWGDPHPADVQEIAGEPVGDLEVVDSMHIRKARTAELSDVFIALPGGFGTLEELFETITWTQLGIHRKPIGLLNVAGFYDPLLAMIEHSIVQGFVRPKYRGMLVAESDPATLLDRLALHESPDGIVRWITPEQA